MNILLGVSGSISAYKSIDIARGLINEGHKVRVVLTPGALEFLKPQVFLYLGIEKVYLSEDDFSYPNVLHIDLCKWADKLAICPLSANTLAKMANGEASGLLTSIVLAWGPSKPILLFPAMNPKMLEHPQTKLNFEKLEAFSNCFIHPTSGGKLACGDYGDGKLPQVEKVIEAILYSNPQLKNGMQTDVVITTGATLSPIDPVRYLTNSSSGITGLYLARTALSKGLRVHLIAGAQATSRLDLLEFLPGITCERVTTPQDMLNAATKAISSAKYYISAAAIGDFEFEVQNSKIKKTTIQESLPLKKAPDVLAHILANKKAGQKIVGFAAETDLTDEVLLEKWTKKPVDFLVGTKVHNGLFLGQESQGFNTQTAYYRFLQNGKFSFEGTLSKEKMSEAIFEYLTEV